MTLIIAGIAAYAVDEDTFGLCLDSLCLLVDKIVVVYGRFKGLDMPWIPSPFENDRWLSSHHPAIRDKVALLQNEAHFPQHIQRNFYLNFLDAGDILIVIDSDEIIIYEEGPIVARGQLGLLLPKGLGSLSIMREDPDNKWTQNSRIYRYYDGMKHNEGQLLMDAVGNTIGPPCYPTQLIPKKYLHIYHKRNENKAYRDAQKKMWGTQSGTE